jgi:hypothetical protein
MPHSAPNPTADAPPETQLTAARPLHDREDECLDDSATLGQILSPWLASLIFHLALLLALALIVLGDDPPPEELGLRATFAEATPRLDALETQLRPQPALLDTPAPQSVERTVIESPVIALKESPAAPPALEAAAPVEPLVASHLMTPVGPRGGGVEGRSSEARGKLLALYGGTPQSEAAVARGLAWLAEHQLPDGSWRLNFHLAPRCEGKCANPGNVGSTTASTALALLPFLGAGSTHERGEYQKVVRRGLYYLCSRMRITPDGGDLQEGTMYAQGLATLALCEAYAMSGDESLRPFAQQAIDFIVHAQHHGGGWRYLPGQAGDTTSFGWQLMALKSGQLAGLRVPSPTMSLASKFLDSVQAEGGANYGYQRPAIDPTMSAIGLLCRMYLGWPRDHDGLTRGVEYLDELGPSANNMYYNYYATQVLHHYEGPYWKPWNEILREHLIATQARKGHETGSWYFEEPHTKTAGRLYNTAMAIMILEVYYRHMPLYKADVLEE